jgi:hypothetical protein
MRLRLWLKKVQDITDLQQLAIVCYEAREKQIKDLNDRETEGGCFKDLAHYLGRLGAHRDAAARIVGAAMKVHSLRQISEVRVVPPSQICIVTLPPGSLDPYDIVKGICKKVSGIGASSCLHTYVDIDYGRDLKQEMQRSHSFRTIVHAELLLVDLFSRKCFDFVDNDAFVGCSKRACYFCYSWISMHHKNFILPARHSKVFLGCRGPDFDPKSDKKGIGAKILINMCRKMVSQLDQDILKNLRSKDGTKTYQHCSSNGSSQAPTINTFVSNPPLRN